ncbi:MAG: SDR family NAD(P)-dependent oxidoreductase [Saprospiraceae bacterium]|nr:SDR family NAD(P)-dependent oxidoreductase [Saprospiraceae bacterium]
MHNRASTSRWCPPQRRPSAVETGFGKQISSSDTYFPDRSRSKEEVLRLGDLIKTHWDTVDLLINNAGIFIQSEMLDEDNGLLENMMNINLYAAYHLTRAIAPMMVERGKDISLISALSPASKLMPILVLTPSRNTLCSASHDAYGWNCKTKV